ncbi:CD7 protein, partial [Orthonyx spaldingii]|nr:CD7 protein [Orthonyx spaldingii]
VLRTQVQPSTVLYVSNLSESKVSPAFENRLEYSREGNRTVITLHKLQEKDSDNYVCAEEVTKTPLLSASGTMVLVQGAERARSQGCDRSFWGLYALAIVVTLLFCALVFCTLYRVHVKKYFQKKKPNVVYEDMSYNSRRSTLVR